MNPVSILLAALIGTFASIFGLHVKEQQDKHKMRRQTVSRLIGCKKLLTASFLEYGYAYIENQYAKAVVDDGLKRVPGNIMLNSLPYKVYEESHERSTGLHLEIAKCQRDLWEIIGHIQLLFHVTEELKEKILLLESIETECNKILEFKKDSILDQGWQESKKEELKELINSKIGPSVNDLINHLKNEIKIYDEMDLWQRLRK